MESEGDELNVADCKQDTEENGNFKMGNQSMNILEQHRIVDLLAQNLDVKKARAITDWDLFWKCSKGEYLF